jgi:hypothetical protein
VVARHFKRSRGGSSSIGRQREGTVRCDRRVSSFSERWRLFGVWGLREIHPDAPAAVEGRIRELAQARCGYAGQIVRALAAKAAAAASSGRCPP